MVIPFGIEEASVLGQRAAGIARTPPANYPLLRGCLGDHEVSCENLATGVGVEVRCGQVRPYHDTRFQNNSLGEVFLMSQTSLSAR
jgi:hypothetical protein